MILHAFNQTCSGQRESLKRNDKFLSLDRRLLKARPKGLSAERLVPPKRGAILAFSPTDYGLRSILFGRSVVCRAKLQFLKTRVWFMPKSTSSHGHFSLELQVKL